VNLSCSIAPSATISPICSVPTSVTITGTAVSTATLTIRTTAPTQSMNLPQRNLFLGGGGSIGLCLLFLGIQRRRRLSWQKLLGIFLLAASIGTIVGCGGGSSANTGGSSTGGTSLGTYTVTVLGVDQATGTVKSNTIATLTVN
jgi:hypothetical protein